MDANRLQKRLDLALNRVSATRVVNRELSQVLDMGDHIFVEVVLNDASKQEAVERAVKSLAESQKRDALKMDYIVRSVWKVEDIRQSEEMSASGVLRAAIPFLAHLVSGRRTIEVPVWMTYSAHEFLLTRPLAIGLPESDLLKAAVREYLEEQLRPGGASYWDPLKHQVSDLNDAAMLFLSRYRPEFYQLKWAVDDFFHTLDNRQLENLSRRRVNLLDFEQAVSELSTQLWGVVRDSAAPPMNVRELVEGLDDRERQALKYYYGKKVREFSKQKKGEFPTLFLERGFASPG